LLESQFLTGHVARLGWEGSHYSSEQLKCSDFCCGRGDRPSENLGARMR